MSLSNIFSRRNRERLFPLALCCLVGALLWRFASGWLSLAVCEKLSGTYLTVFSVCLGFVFASISTLIGLSDKPFLKGMREAGSFGLLISYHWSCVRWCSVGMALGIAVLYWPSAWFRLWQGAFFIAVGVGAILSAWRILRLFARVIHYVNTT